MSIYLDSAIPDEARQAMSLGFVQGITTNPALLAKVKRPPTEVLRELGHICSGTVFYQLTAPTVAERRAEGEQILRLNDEFEEEEDRHSVLKGDSSLLQLGRIGLKIPAATENMALVAEFSDKGVAVAVTALFSPAQAYLACEAGATYLLPYVNRMTRLRGDGLAFVRELAQICKAIDRGTEILAASIKSPEEAVQTLLAGAHHISAPLSVLLAMGHDPLSDEAVAEFAQAMLST
ncbi:MAG: transaldolase family protein [Anaerolineae bacterium]